MKLFKILDCIVQVLLTITWILYPNNELESPVIIYRYVHGFLLLTAWQTISLTIHWIALGGMDKDRRAYFITLFIVLCCLFAILFPFILYALGLVVLLLIVVSVLLPFSYLFISVKETVKYFKPPDEPDPAEEAI